MGRKTIASLMSTMSFILFTCLGCREVYGSTSPKQIFPRTACTGKGNMFVFDRSCYHFVTDKVNMTTARRECESHGFHLVFIESGGEQSFIASTASRDLLKKPDYWIGIEKVDNVKLWMDGREIGYSNFGIENEGGECIRLKRAHDYMWHDRKCDLKFGYICEREFVESGTSKFRLLTINHALYQSQVYSTVTAMSLNICAMSCYNSPMCFRFSFTQESSECVLGSAPSNGNVNFVESSGAKTYAMY